MLSIVIIKKGQVQWSCDFSGSAIVSQTPPSGANSVYYSRYDHYPS
ncbi:hypothetical protein HanPSC8_Chr09g0363611 [Helianthus annuus]|nr:hypothetical protein HanPSC8_Chr09g0363611 [Helianthus annuus]